jgi:hypothetical protein
MAKDDRALRVLRCGSGPTAELREYSGGAFGDGSKPVATRSSFVQPTDLAAVGRTIDQVIRTAEIRHLGAFVPETGVGTRTTFVAIGTRRRGRHKTCEKNGRSEECDLRFHGSISNLWSRTIRNPARAEMREDAMQIYWTMVSPILLDWKSHSVRRLVRRDRRSFRAWVLNDVIDGF